MLLRAQRRTQLADHLRAANIWTETGYVFTTETGEPVDPRSLYRVVSVAGKKLGLSGIGPHTLRHSGAATMLRSGADIKTVSDLLGHSSIAITGDIYGHTSLRRRGLPWMRCRRRAATDRHALLSPRGLAAFVRASPHRLGSDEVFD